MADLDVDPVHCPLDEEEERWVDEVAKWVLAVFGEEYLRAKVQVLPTRGFFDRRFDGSEEDADWVLRKLCGIMEVDPERIVLVFHSEGPVQLSEAVMTQLDRKEPGAVTGTAGHYLEREDGRFEISIETEGLKDTVSLLATMGHELAHVKLLGEKRIQENDENLTDLLPVFFGLGIFAANGVHRQQNWKGIAYGGWRISRQGYLPQRIFGYAIAQWSLWRGDDPKPIAKHLDTNARASFEETLRYLEQGDEE